jgi:hypothetical protein
MAGEGQRGGRSPDVAAEHTCVAAAVASHHRGRHGATRRRGTWEQQRAKPNLAELGEFGVPFQRSSKQGLRLLL